MYYKVITLDNRYAGSTYWKYRLEFTKFRPSHAGTIVTRYCDFQTMREWLWEIYGPSYERNLHESITVERNIQAHGLSILPFGEFATTPDWCWHHESNGGKLHIYLKDDQQLSHVQLKWAVDGK